MKTFPYQYNDGGREQDGYKGFTNDCVVRSLAIAENRPYHEVYKEVKRFLGKGQSPRNRIPTKVTKRLMEHYGYTWKTLNTIGQVHKVHLNKDELDTEGTIIASVSKHVVCIKDSVIHDTFNPSREGYRIVYGYWYKED